MLVSFILPAFKGSFLRESIESILNQSYKDFELIIVNDGSPDDIKQIVSSFHDSRIRYFENDENIGGKDLVKNWNHCLSFATGKWGVLASDDDIYTEAFLSELIKLVEKYPNVNLAHCRHRIINEYGETLGFSEPCLEFECAEEFIFHNIIRRRRQVAPDFMFRISALREIGGFVNFPMAWGSDDATWSRLSLTGSVTFSQQVLFSWRISGQNISSQKSNLFAKAKTRILLLNYFRNEIFASLDMNSEVSAYFRKLVVENLEKSIRAEISYSITHSHSINLLLKSVFGNELNCLLHFPAKMKMLITFFYIMCRFKD